jgi:hypothetical protein
VSAFEGQAPLSPAGLTEKAVSRQGKRLFYLKRNRFARIIPFYL